MTSLIRTGGVIVFVATGIQLWASPCFTELNKIVRSTKGRITARDGKRISNAEVIVRSTSREVIFKTRSNSHGAFRLKARAGKYQVEIKANGYLRFFYVADLRSVESVEKEAELDISLQDEGECHDMRAVDEHEEVCESEPVKSNLELRTATLVKGHVKDETGAPLENSEIRLRSVSELGSTSGDGDKNG